MIHTLKKKTLLFCIFLIPTLGFSQLLQTTSYRNTRAPYTEIDPSHYDFAYPICADILTASSFNPPNDGVYLKATYGHRYLSSTARKSDNHGGFDYWSDHTCNNTTYDSNNPIALICMCEGTISQVINGPDSVVDMTAIGRSVQVTCNASYQTIGSSILINYRHLKTLGRLPTMAEGAMPNTIAISKGDTIGIMGASGTTSNVHLHLSTQTAHPLYGNAFVHTSRLFDPTLHPNVLSSLTHANIELLKDWPDSALFRITWPFNQTITRFEFSNTSYSIVFDKEKAYDTGSAIRDEHDCTPGVKVYAYQFNGKQTVLNRYSSEKANMPARYPASPQRDANLALYNYNHIPITHDSIVFVYDFIVTNLPPSHNKDSFIVKVNDVWGYTVEGSFNSPTAVDNPVSENENIHLFPNPTTGRLKISFEKEIPARKIDLFDIYGMKVSTLFTRKPEAQLDISYLPEGIYFLSVQVGKGYKTMKVIKN
ncbi:T9SS type A sorting domain-containing protein [bacterium]|nr:T9SS type A sorting domain-containing protein [bacterium]